MLTRFYRNLLDLDVTTAYSSLTPKQLAAMRLELRTHYPIFALIPESGFATILRPGWESYVDVFVRRSEVEQGKLFTIFGMTFLTDALEPEAGKWIPKDALFLVSGNSGVRYSIADFLESPPTHISKFFQ